MNLSEETLELHEVVSELSTNLQADIFILSGEISEKTADLLIYQVRNVQERQDNVGLILTTFGGDADAAFRIMRFLQRKYEKITLYIFGYCKSAGTLMALGAHEIVMSDFGEFGPLDVQVLKNGELYGRSSGLDIHQALDVIGSQAYMMFEGYLDNLTERTQGQITTKIAADIVSSMAVQLLTPIMAQIDPLHLGEMNRVIRVAQDYGQRLSSKISSQNRGRTITQLTSGYHQHGFVIDYEEAKQLFQDVEVREPTEIEQELETLLMAVVRAPADDIVQWLKPVASDDEEGENEEDEANNGEQRTQGHTTGDVPRDDGKNEEIQQVSLQSTENNHR
ncbi:MAG: SDH family Clp fold serine proteinase [Nostoc sp.]